MSDSRLPTRLSQLKKEERALKAKLEILRLELKDLKEIQFPDDQVEHRILHIKADRDMALGDLNFNLRFQKMTRDDIELKHDDPNKEKFHCVQYRFGYCSRKIHPESESFYRFAQIHGRRNEMEYRTQSEKNSFPYTFLQK